MQTVQEMCGYYQKRALPNYHNAVKTVILRLVNVVEISATAWIRMEPKFH